MYSCAAPEQTGSETPAAETGATVHTQEIDPVRTHGSVSPRTERINPQGSQGPAGTNPEEENYSQTNTYGRRYYEDTYGSPYDPNTRPSNNEGRSMKRGPSGSTNNIQQQNRADDDQEDN